MTARLDSRLRGNDVALRGSDMVLRGNDPLGGFQVSNFDFRVSLLAPDF
jgi:hypothetical protein